MSIADITRASVLAAIRAGHITRAELADRFEVLCSSRHLSDVLEPLLASGEVVEHESGVLHINDLIEQLPHDPEEGQ